MAIYIRPAAPGLLSRPSRKPQAPLLAAVALQFCVIAYLLLERRGLPWHPHTHHNSSTEPGAHTAAAESPGSSNSTSISDRKAGRALSGEQLAPCPAGVSTEEASGRRRGSCRGKGGGGVPQSPWQNAPLGAGPDRQHTCKTPQVEAALFYFKKSVLLPGYDKKPFNSDTAVDGVHVLAVPEVAH